MSWLASQIQLPDHISHVLIDDRFKQSAPVAELPCLNWFGIWFIETPPDHAFIAAHEQEGFERVERALLAAIDQAAEGWAVYGLRVMSFGIAEFYFYSKDETTLDGVLAEMKTAYPAYRIEQASKTDEGWAVYQKFLQAIPTA